MREGGEGGEKGKRACSSIIITASRVLRSSLRVLVVAVVRDAAGAPTVARRRRRRRADADEGVAAEEQVGLDMRLRPRQLQCRQRLL